MRKGVFVPLAALRTADVTPTWQEAVAIVIDVCEQMRTADESLVTPDLQHVLLSLDHGVTIVAGSPIPTHPVRQIAGILRELLRDATTPVALRRLVAQNHGERPRCAWLEEFVTALSYFERPNRAQTINALIVRAQIARESGHRPSAPHTVQEA